MLKFSRRQVAKVVADKLLAGEPSKKVIAELAAYLITHKQLSQADMYLADVESLLADRGYVVADVTSAHPLDEDLRAHIKRLVGTGAKTVALREQVDSDLIGGVIVKARGKQIDTSIRTTLQQLRTRG